MKKLINAITKRPLLLSNILVLVGINLYNFGQTIFQIIMGRFLGRSGYADIAVIISVLGMAVIIQQAFGLTIIKYVSVGKNKKFVINFTRWIFLWSFWVGIFLALIFFILSPFLADFLHISQPGAMLLISPIIVFLVLLNSARSVFQGLLKFVGYVYIHLTEVIVKLILAVVLIFLGWDIFGVIVAIMVGVVASSLLAYFLLNKYIIGKRSKAPEILPLLKYSLPVFLLSMAMTSMYSTDIILVKHFFIAEETGLYAALAKLGSIAFFAAAPIASVMFPHITSNHSKGKSYRKYFYLSCILVLTISIFVVTIYKIFPLFVINLLFGSQFTGGDKILWLFGVNMLLLGLAVLFTQFYFAIGKTKIVSFFVMAAILQAILIWFFHPSLLGVIQASILSMSLLVIILLVYFIYLKTKR